MNTDRFAGMTVNERLFDAGLFDEYERLTSLGDLAALNELLAKVGLRQDANGMNWSLNDNAEH